MMRPKPVGLGPEYAAQFADPSVVAAYGYRPPYPAETFDMLVGLMGGEPGAVLDVGCGTGAIARGLAGRVARVDAVDPSPAMIAAGKRLPGGDSPNLAWTVGRAEDAPLRPPYALIVAGASLHWMDLDIVLPRFRDALAPGGYLAIVDDEVATPWDDPLRALIPRYSTNKEYVPYDLVAELEARGLFVKRGMRRTDPVLVAQPVDAYVESFHARNGFSRDRMTVGAAARFDTAVRALVSPYSHDGTVALRVVATVVWGRPATR